MVTDNLINLEKRAVIMRGKETKTSYFPEFALRSCTGNEFYGYDGRHTISAHRSGILLNTHCLNIFSFGIGGQYSEQSVFCDENYSSSTGWPNIYFGASDRAPDKSDYALYNGYAVNTDFTHIKTTFNKEIKSDMTGITMTVTAYYRSLHELVIREVGLAAPVMDKSNKDCRMTLLTRDVLDEPLTVPEDYGFTLKVVLSKPFDDNNNTSSILNNAVALQRIISYIGSAQDDYSSNDYIINVNELGAALRNYAGAEKNYVTVNRYGILGYPLGFNRSYGSVFCNLNISDTSTSHIQNAIQIGSGTSPTTGDMCDLQNRYVEGVDFSFIKIESVKTYNESSVTTTFIETLQALKELSVSEAGLSGDLYVDNKYTPFLFTRDVFQEPLVVEGGDMFTVTTSVTTYLHD